jgi:hypothetical protein
MKNNLQQSQTTIQAKLHQMLAHRDLQLLIS